MSGYSFLLPPDFADYEWEVMAKGSFSGAQIFVDGKCYRLNFYEAVRLGQQIEGELANDEMFFEPNLIVVRSVTRENMEPASTQLVQSGRVNSLVAE